jgi:predicted nucleic acid-binding protein
MFDPLTSLHAPHLVDIEVTHAFRRLVQRKDITAVRAEEGLADFAQLPIERHGHQALTRRIWQLRDAMTAYDGAYVALAEALDAPLLTCDAKLAHAHGHRARIDLIANE